MEIVITYVLVGLLSAFAVSAFLEYTEERKADKREREIIKSIIKEERY